MNDWVIAGVAVIAACIMLGQLGAFFVARPSVVVFDEGYTAALAERMLDGKWLPYVDGVSHRGPLLYWSVAVFQELTGRFNWAGLRWLSIVLTFSTLLATFAVGAVARVPVAGAIGALLYVFLLSLHEVVSSFGVSGEAVASPPMMIALALTALAATRLESRRSLAIALFLAGAFAALAALAKQTALGVVGPLALWSALRLRADSVAMLRQKLLLCATFVLGFVLPILIVLGRYAYHGELKTFWYWYYEYNAKVYMRPYVGANLRDQFDMLTERDQWPLLTISVAAVAALSSALAALRPRAPEPRLRVAVAGFELTLGLLILLTLAGGVAPFRYFHHYWIPLFPLGALAVGVAITRIIDRAGGSAGYGFLAKSFCLLAIGGITLFTFDHRLRMLRLERERGGWSGATPEPICDYLAAHASPEAPLFIWGFDGDIYVTCRRHPASRFVYLTLVAGNVPGPWWKQPRPEGVARGSREQLMSDLDATRPPIILEMPNMMHGVTLSAFPELKARVVRDYCKQPVVKAKDGRTAIRG